MQKVEQSTHHQWLNLRGLRDDGTFLPRPCDLLFKSNTNYCGSEWLRSHNWTPLSDSAALQSQLSEFLQSSQVPYIDSHCHLDLMCSKSPFFRVGQLFNKYARIIPKNFHGLIATFCDPATYSPSINYPNEESLSWLSGVLKHESVLGATYGVHPHMAEMFNEELGKCIEEMFFETKRNAYRAVAVGECGFDLSLEDEGKFAKQEKAFGCQLRIAKQAEVPVVIHCRSRDRNSRNLERKAIDTAKKELQRFSAIHLHCFTEGSEIAEMWMAEFPFVYFGFTPRICTASPTENISLAAARLPLDRILLETDAPYFRPPQYAINGMERNFNIPPGALAVAIRIAQLKNAPLDLVLEATLSNTKRLYSV